MDYNWSNFATLSPIVVFVIGGCVLLMSEVFMTGKNRSFQAGLSTVFAVLAGLIAFSLADRPPTLVFNGFAQADPFSEFLTVLIAGSLALTSLVSQSYLKTQASERGEFHALAHFAAAGMSLLVVATDLITIFIALEVMSLAVYALVAWIRSTPRTSEAALKYFVLGSFASAIFLYGAALAYGAAGSTRLVDIAQTASSGPTPLLVAALALLGAGFLFKIAAVPFHTWAPDVYDGAPSPVTGFMAAGVKLASFAVLIRLFLTVFGSEAFAFGSGKGWYELLKWIAIATMVVGNLLALAQSSVKRMLAYSSISHAGYVLVALTVGAFSNLRSGAVQSMLFYLAIYAVTAVGAFAVCAALEKRGLGTRDDDGRYDGLAERQPVLAFVMALFMLSLAGIPPTAGFAAKLFIFRSALDANEILLTVVGLLSSVAGLYYYLRVVAVMYMKPSRAEAPVAPKSRLFGTGLALTALATLLFGLLPSWLGEFAASASLLGLSTP